MTTKAIILAAGKGTRMQSDKSKVLHEICGKPMLSILLETAKKINTDEICVVIGPDSDDIKNLLGDIPYVVQHDRLGTAHAVLASAQYIQPFTGCVLILYGDQPLFSPKTLQKIQEKCLNGADVVVLGFIPEDARRYGRLVMGTNGLDSIVEYKDATDAQRAIKLCNSGVVCVNGQHLLSLLKEVKNENASEEYYLTDIVAIAKKYNLSTDVVISSADEAHGVNTCEELMIAEEIYKKGQQQ